MALPDKQHYRSRVHSVAVYASTVLEAAAAGLKQIGETEMIGELKAWLEKQRPRSS